MPLNAGAAEVATEPLEFADGSVVAVRPFTIKMHRMWEALQQHETVDKLVALLRECLPEATDEEIDNLTGARVALVIAHAQGRLAQALATLEGNGGAGPAATAAKDSAPRPSTPTTNSTTSSRASGASRAARGTTGTTRSPAGASSTRSTV